jgi:hypothetical protein
MKMKQCLLQYDGQPMLLPIVLPEEIAVVGKLVEITANTYEGPRIKGYVVHTVYEAVAMPPSDKN